MKEPEGCKMTELRGEKLIEAYVAIRRLVTIEVLL